MTVTLHEVLLAAELRKASLVAELSGYLVLGALDRIVGAPRVLDPDHVALESDGAVSVTGGGASDEPQAEKALRLLLVRCLRVSRPGAPAIQRAAASSVQLGIRGFIAELEAALIPVNRAAGRRALARLHRETQRAKESGLLSEAPARVSIDARVDETAERDRVVVPPSSVGASSLPGPIPRTRLAPVEMLSPPPPLCMAPDQRVDTTSGGTPLRARGFEDEEETHPIAASSPGSPGPLDEITAPVPVTAIEGRTERIVLPCAGTQTTRVERQDVQSRAGQSSDCTDRPVGRFAFAGEQEASAARVEVAERRIVTERIDVGLLESARARPATDANQAPSPGTRGESDASQASDGALLGKSDRAHVPGQGTPPEECGAKASEVPGGRSRTGTLGAAGSGVSTFTAIPPAPRVFAPRRSDISQLVDDFGTSGVRSDREVCRDLQQLAGVDATPGNLPLVTRRS